MYIKLPCEQAGLTSNLYTIIAHHKDIICGIRGSCNPKSRNTIFSAIPSGIETLYTQAVLLG